jgi:exonuclease SbcC
MIPISLKLQGINSYQKAFEIDFNKLVEGQLFGIFGPVGSGKSTILEAISMALYGETERLHARDDRNYNLMNLQSDELLIDYTFRLDPENQEYRFVVRGKRNSKNFDKVNTFDRQAYKKEQGEWLPIQQKAEEIIGLSYQNFRRTVIIPQGKFQEFLQLGSKDRTQMLKEIFGLERFDLYGKVASLDKKTQFKKENLEGQISQYADLSEEILKEKQEELKQLSKALQTQEERMQYLLSVQDVLAKYLQAKESTEKHETALAAHVAKLKRTAELLQSQQRDFESTQKEYAQLDKFRQKKRELQSLKTINANQQTIANNQARLEKGMEVLRQTQEAGKALKTELKEKERQFKKLRSNRPDFKELSDIKIWFSEKEQKQKQIQTAADEVEQDRAAIKAISKSAFAPLSDYIGSDQAIIGASDKLDKLEQFLEKEQKSLTKKIEQLQKEEQEVLVQVKLGDWAKDLNSGEPCPLCGSTHHPNLHNDEALIKQLKVVEQKIKKCKDDEAEVNRLLRDFDQKKVLLNAKKEQLEQHQQRLDAAKQGFEHFLESYIWDQFGADQKDAFLETYDKAKSLEQELLQQEGHLGHLREQLEENQSNEERYRKGLEDIKHQQLSLEAENKALEKGLQLLKVQDYAGESENNLNQHIYELENQIGDLEFNYKNAEEKLKAQEKAYNSLQGEEKILIKNTEEAKQDLEKRKTALLDIIQSKPKLELTGITFQENNEPELDAALFERQLTEENQSFETQKELHANLKNEVQRLEADLKKKLDLTKALEAINKRLEQLKMLKNLFKGSGFVDFISSIYLEELCHAANERFYKLTRQQLKLEITGKNAFIVRDYLNQGRIRSAKTLSGGQTFQAALSLALALAESIRSQNKAQQNFFFMDEGFGSQDQEALQLVLKTLKSLRKENRVVGIISHVEELKNEIEVFLTIENKEGAGSEIRTSWE